MKRVIFTPNPDVIIPEIAVYYVLPTAGPVFDCLVDDSYDPDGAVFYNSDPDAPKALAEPFIHHYAGWEV